MKLCQRTLLFSVFLASTPTAVWAENYVVRGSSTIYPICRAASPQIAKSTGDIVKCEGGGSEFGIAEAENGGLGTVSRELSAQELRRGLRAHPIGMDAIVFVTSGDHGLKNLTQAQLKKILNGQLQTWEQLGGKGGGLLVAGENADHGTHKALLELLGLAKITLDEQKNNEVSRWRPFLSHNQTLAFLKDNPSAIGFLPLALVAGKEAQKAALTAIPIEGVAPNLETVKQRKYVLTRPLQIVTKGTPSNGQAKVISFFHTPAGRKVVMDLNFCIWQKD